MKKTKLLALFLALLMVFSCFAACADEARDSDDDDDYDPPKSSSNKDDDDEDEDKEPSVDSEEPSDSDDSDDAEEPTEDAVQVSGLNATKIATVKKNLYDFGDTGIVYKTEDKMYGLVSLDGEIITDAKYGYCEVEGAYFKVSLSKMESFTNADDLNCIGVVDANGNEIIPMEYAVIDEINERYFRVCEVTEQTENKDEALVYYSTDIFSLGADDDDTLFKGNWYIYDMVTAQKLEGATGTKANNIYSSGDFVQYTTDDGTTVKVNHKGEYLPEGASLLDNGMYKIVEGNTGYLCDSEGTKLFEYDLDGFVPSSISGDYLIGRKYVDYEPVYVIMDTAGNILSAEFNAFPDVRGSLVLADDIVCNFAGEQVYNGKAKHLHAEETFGLLYVVRNDYDFAIIKEDGTVLFEGTEDDVYSVDYYTSFTIKMEQDGKALFYCMEDQDFTIEGYAVGPYLIKVTKPNYVYDLVDSLGGRTLLKNYEGYFIVETADSTLYVYAESASGDFDIYTIEYIP